MLNKHFSPNHSSRGKTPVTGIIIHHWGNPANYRKPGAVNGVINWLSNPKSRVSAHAVISPDSITQLVDFERAAWHAGNAQVNRWAIGLELMPYDALTPSEKVNKVFENTAQLIAMLWEKYPQLVGKRLTGHNTHKATTCPGNWTKQLPALQQRAQQIYNQKNNNYQPRLEKVLNMTLLLVDSIDFYYYDIARLAWIPDPAQVEALQTAGLATARITSKQFEALTRFSKNVGKTITLKPA